MAATEQEQQSTRTAPRQQGATTEYVILMQGGRGNEDNWSKVTEMSARDAASAIRALAEGKVADVGISSGALNASVTFVAIPARSWKPLSVKTETHTTITIEDAT